MDEFSHLPFCTLKSELQPPFIFGCNPVAILLCKSPIKSEKSRESPHAHYLPWQINKIIIFINICITIKTEEPSLCL